MLGLCCASVASYTALCGVYLRSMWEYCQPCLSASVGDIRPPVAWHPVNDASPHALSLCDGPIRLAVLVGVLLSMLLAVIAI